MKYVKDYHVTHYTSGIVCLLFNTTERWIDFHRYNDFLYRIGEAQREDESYESYKERLVEIPEDTMVFTFGKQYIRTEQQEKDQISFLFIPFDLLKREKYVDGIHSEG